VKLKCVLKRVEGRANITVPPPPFSRMAFSFLHEPVFELDVSLQVGSTKQLPNSIRTIFDTKLKEILLEKFVHPNRKYFRLPGSVKMEPPRPFTSIKVDSLPLDPNVDEHSGEGLEAFEVQMPAVDPPEEGEKEKEERELNNLHLHKGGGLSIKNKSDEKKEKNKRDRDSIKMTESIKEKIHREGKPESFIKEKVHKEKRTQRSQR